MRALIHWLAVCALGSASAAVAAPAHVAAPALSDELGLAETATDAEAHDAEGLDDDVETATLAEAAPTLTSTGPRYTGDVSDARLAALWAGDRAQLGSVSLGTADFGRVVNGVKFPEDPRWVVVDPENTWGTQESVDYLRTVLEEMVALHPEAPPVRVNHMSAPRGGYLRPHRTHQLGRDVDVGLYYADGHVPDLQLNWVLLRLLITRTDVEVVLLDRRLIRAMKAHAASQGEDPAWLDAVFGPSRRPLVQHAPRHRDHFHVRFYSPRAQELGWRVQPLLAKDEEVPQVMRHRIRAGDSLGKIAQRYGISIAALKRINRLRSSFIRAGQSLAVPVRGLACERCPTMARVVVPPRLLPPEVTSGPTLASATVMAPVSTVAAAPTAEAAVAVAGAAPVAAVTAPDAAPVALEAAVAASEAEPVTPVVASPAPTEARADGTAEPRADAASEAAPEGAVPGPLPGDRTRRGLAPPLE